VIRLRYYPSNALTKQVYFRKYVRSLLFLNNARKGTVVLQKMSRSRAGHGFAKGEEARRAQATFSMVGKTIAVF
jgi:hypothetical protein